MANNSPNRCLRNASSADMCGNKKLVEAELLDEFQRQPRSAELPTVLHADSRAVDLDEPRLDIRCGVDFGVGCDVGCDVDCDVDCDEQSLMLLLFRQGRRIDGLIHTEPPGFVHQSQIRHGPLPRAALRAIGLDVW